MRKLLKNLLFVLLIFLVISGVFSLVGQEFQGKTEIPLTGLVEKINEGKVK